MRPRQLHASYSMYVLYELSAPNEAVYPNSDYYLGKNKSQISFLLLFMRWLFNHDCVQDLLSQILVAKQYSSSDTQITPTPFTNNLLKE